MDGGGVWGWIIYGDDNVVHIMLGILTGVLVWMVREVEREVGHFTLLESTYYIGSPHTEKAFPPPPIFWHSQHTKLEDNGLDGGKGGRASKHFEQKLKTFSCIITADAMREAPISFSRKLVSCWQWQSWQKVLVTLFQACFNRNTPIWVRWIFLNE